MRVPTAIALLALAAAAPARAGSGGSITDGDVTFTRDPLGFDDTPAADLTGVVGGLPAEDTLFGVGWWFRFGTGPEMPFGTPSGVPLYGGGESSIDWDGLGKGSFDAHEASFVFDAGLPFQPGDGGYVVQYLTLTNLSNNTPLNVHLFHYLDFDLQPNAGDDTATRVEWATVEFHDAPITAGYWAERPLRHQIATPGTLRGLLNDDSASTLSNGGSPFGPGDVSAAYEWYLGIPPSGSVEVKVVFAVNTKLRCGKVFDEGVFCDSLESGNRSFWSSSVP